MALRCDGRVCPRVCGVARSAGRVLLCTGRVASWLGTLFLRVASRLLFFFSVSATPCAGLVQSLPQCSSAGRQQMDDGEVARNQRRGFVCCCSAIVSTYYVLARQDGARPGMEPRLRTTTMDTAQDHMYKKK